MYIYAYVLSIRKLDFVKKQFFHSFFRYHSFFFKETFSDFKTGRAKETKVNNLKKKYSYNIQNL